MATKSALRSLSFRRIGAFKGQLSRPSVIAPSVVLQATPWQSRTYARQTPLTTEQYPNLKRDERFKTLDNSDIEHFKSILSSPETTVLTEDLEPYNVDWMNKYKGQSKLVLKPKTTAEVAAILKYCNEKKLAIVPQGGNTGLVGGGVPIFDEIVLSTANLKTIRSFDDVSGVLVCDAGCILEELDNYLAKKGYMMPLDLGAKGSCHIGGNVATNAGGLRLLRYGSLHGSVLGIEAVLPDGTIMDNLSTLRKDNTGYDLKQLFIGSEGTIGIITGISILTPKRPNAINVALLGLESYDKVRECFQKSRKGLSEILSAFEFWDEHAFDLVRAHSSSERSSPLETEHPFYVLIETQGSNSEHDQVKLQSFLEKAFEEEVVTDGVVADNETQKLNLWSLREGIPEACGKLGAVYKYDISLPLPVLYDMVDDMRQKLTEAGVVADSIEDDSKPVKKVVGYGHIGDGNVHLNIVASRYEPAVAKVIEPFVYEWTAKHNGSISAEHGLGLMKAPYVGYSKSKTMIDLMKKIKTLFDPNGILNPHKYI